MIYWAVLTAHVISKLVCATGVWLFLPLVFSRNTLAAVFGSPEPSWLACLSLLLLIGFCCPPKVTVTNASK